MGGYVITGWTRSFGAGGLDAYLIKTDAMGDTVRTSTYGGSENDGSACVEQTNDGGYIVAGTTYSFGSGGGDVYLIRTDQTRNSMWTHTSGGTSVDEGYWVGKTDDGGYIVAGNCRLYGTGGSDVWLLKTDAAGDTSWTRTYGGEGTDFGRCVEQTIDEGVHCCGTHHVIWGRGGGFLSDQD